MNRAYAVLNLKAADESRRTFTGTATTPATDRMGDVVEPKGATFKLPIPLLWQHDSAQPIGWVRRARVSASGIEIEGEVADIPEQGVLKDRLLEAWQSIKSGLVRGLSIGFTPLDAEPLDPKRPYGAMKFLKWEWLELSAVTIPANAQATIVAVKSFAAKQTAASGRSAASSGKPSSTGRAGPSASNPSIHSKGSTVKVYNAESLAQLQEQRQTKAARMAELSEQKGEDGFTDDQRAEFDGLRGEIRNLDDEIAVTEVHVGNIAKAKPVDSGSGRSAPYGFAKKLKDVEPKFKGEEGLKRLVCQLDSSIRMKSGLGYIPPEVLAEQRFGKTNPTLVAIMKASVAGGGTDTGEPWAELAQVDGRYSGDFIEYLYGATAFDKLPLREVPSNVAIKGQDGAFTGYWVGQSKGIPMSQGSASTASTAPLKVAALTVVSNELIRDSSPAALSIIGDSLRRAIAETVDSKFFSGDAASAGVSPAGMLNGVSGIASVAGGDADSIYADVMAVTASFRAAKNAQGFYWAMTPTTAFGLSLMRNSLSGTPAFPGVTPEGGTFLNYPVAVGDNVPADAVILLQPREIWKIGDLGVQFSTSTEAMIEQATDPAGATDTPVAAANYMTSMFQEESTAIKVVRPINFGKRRSSAVAYLTAVNWGAPAS